MDFTLSKNIPGLLIFIDFQKAFDCLKWNFLFSRLKVFNFGSDFIRWVEIFYKNIQSCVINNGFASDFFALERGVRQGDKYLIFQMGKYECLMPPNRHSPKRKSVRDTFACNYELSEKYRNFV